MGEANAQILTTIITGGVTIVSAIVAFAASCKNGNNVTRQSKSDLKLEHEDLNYTLQSERQSMQSSLKSDISNSQNSVENKVNSGKEIINVEIAKSEERRKNLTPDSLFMILSKKVRHKCLTQNLSVIEF